MTDTPIKTGRKFPKSVDKILVIKSAQAGGAHSLEVKVKAQSDAADPGKPRISKKYRRIEREMRAFTRAAQAYLHDIEARHKRSNEKKSNGSLRDLMKNSYKASVKAKKVLRDESRLYKKAKVARKLHDAVGRVQRRALT